MPSLPGISRAFHALLLEDWLLKALCLGLAVLLWIYSDGELMDRRDFVVSLRQSDLVLPVGWALAADRVLPKFQVSLRGPRRRMQFISADSISLKKPKVISNAVPGPNALTVEPLDLQAEGCDVLAVSSRDEKGLAVYLVSTAKRQVRVRVKTAGQVSPGFVAEAGTAYPDQVSIEGPSTDLDEVTLVWTEDVDISNAKQDVVQEVNIEPFLEVGGRRVKFRCNTPVLATVPVHHEQATKRLLLDVRPLALPGAAMAVAPDTVEVEVKAETPDLAAPDLKSSIVLFADWPTNWELPKDEKTVLGPVRVQVRVFAPPRLQVRGINEGPLPTVEVRGALAGQLQPRK